MIKTALEQAIKSIEAEKSQKLNEVKEKITREKILPFNAEIDTARSKALAELDTELNQRVTEIRKEYDEKKQELVRLGEEKKRQNAETLLTSEMAVVSVRYDNAVSKLKQHIEETEE